MHIAFGFKAIKTKQFVFIYAFHYVSMTLLLHFSKKWKEETLKTEFFYIIQVKLQK